MDFNLTLPLLKILENIGNIDIKYWEQLEIILLRELDTRRT